MSAATVVFDLDGTLVHTAPDLARVLTRVLADAGLPPADVDEVTRLVGGGLASLMRKAFARRGDPEAEVQAEARAQAFLRYALEAPAPQSRVYEGVFEALEGLRAEGHRLAVCTNKAEPLARAVLDALGLLPLVHGLVGGGARPKKPDPAPVFEAIRRAGGQREGAVFVGDSETDLLAARAAGLPCVLVDFGYHQGRLPALDPDALVSRFADVPAAVARLVSAGHLCR